jgi:pyruvate dehydrogenase E1 component alpha subunit
MTKEAVQASTSTLQPAFLRIKCHRYLEHVGINEDWHEGYRDKQKYSWWYENDSLKLQRQKLIEIGFEENVIKTYEDQIKDKVEQAILKAEQASFCPTSHLETGVFHEKN